MSDSTKEWHRKIIDLLHAFETDLCGGEVGQEIDARLDGSDWLFNAGIAAAKPMTPGLFGPGAKKPQLGSKFIGRATGMTVAHFRALSDESTAQALVDRWNTEVIPKIPDAEPINLEMTEEEKAEDARTRAKFQAMLARVFAIVAKQSTEDHILFFQGYTESLRRGSIGKDGLPVALTDASQVHQILFVLGPVFEKEHTTIADIHRLLVKLLGANKAGDLKRTEKLCQRLGYSAANRGRPKGAD